jgi:hypothetical protein
VLGLVAIFGLLNHKPELTPRDHALLDVFATHAAVALEAALCAAVAQPQTWRVAQFRALLANAELTPPDLAASLPSGG